MYDTNSSFKDVLNKAKELGLDNQVNFELADYREISGNYDNQKGAVGIAFRIFLRFRVMFGKIKIF